jgi:hypothetical protein
MIDFWKKYTYNIHIHESALMEIIDKDLSLFGVYPTNRC